MKSYDLRLIHGHLSYSAAEVSNLLSININTVRKWVAQGLKPIDERHPQLFHGTVLTQFLRARLKPHEPLGPGEFFCVCCKGSRLPLDGQIRLVPRSPTTVDFVANCVVCQRRLFRRVRLAEVLEKIGEAQLILDDGTSPVSSDGERLRVALSKEMVS